METTFADSWSDLFMSYAKNKDADQPEHWGSLISIFMSPHFRVGRPIVFARVVCPSVSRNRVRSITQKPFEIFS